VDVTADDDWGSDGHDVRFFSQYFLGLGSVGVTFSQRSLTSAYGRGLQASMSSICLSRLL
jgi:hypothetical protein